jgi:hypothetical protein
MNRTHIALGLGGLLVGLLLGGGAARQATAQGGPPPRRFEYSCVPSIEKPWRPEGVMKLNTLGAQGWELVQQLPHNPDVYCFKRALMF